MGVASLLKARHVGIRELKARLSGLLKQGQPLVATDHGTPTHFVIPYDDMVEIVEIFEELSDPSLVARVTESRKARAAGGWVPASRLLSRLGKKSAART